MDAELRVLAPRVPVRKIKFVRHSQEVQPGKWALVDVSIDEILGVPPAYIASRLRPSGCLVEDRNNGYCKVLYSILSLWPEITECPCNLRYEKLSVWFCGRFLDIGLKLQ
jgi:homeobox-leucine zipper protein